MDTIHHILSALEQCHLHCVLATIVQVDGSAYRKAGTTALFVEDGTQVGVLSAGCVDIDVAARVPDILSREVSECVVYDLRTEDDFSWGKGPGCNGIIHVLLEPVSDEFRHDLLRTKHYLDNRCCVSLIREVSDGAVSQYMFMVEPDSHFGAWNGDIPVAAREWCSNLPPFIQKGVWGFTDSHSAPLFVQCLWPKPRLIIFGAGPDTRPLAAFAAHTGFSVTVCDWRDAYTSAVHFPGADILRVANLIDATHHLCLGELDSVVIMTHSFETDRALLLSLSHTRLLYLGILGKQTRTSRLLQGHYTPAWLHSPVGLPICAEGPEEIAISVLAELIKTIRMSGG